jgi:hypothetical protein
MAETIISGQNNLQDDLGFSAGSQPINRRVLDVFDKMSMLDPSESPFVILTKNMGHSPCKSPDFYHYEKASFPGSDTVNYSAGYPLGTEIDIVVDNITYWRAYDTAIVDYGCHGVGFTPDRHPRHRKPVFDSHGQGHC